MYKLLIVDDEPTVRFGLQSYFDWSAYGIEVIGEADDGDVALEMIEKQPPDLILTDVRMPNLDGIALSRRVAERYPDVKILFVSGHDDADYLKSALKLSAVDYIFKPVNLQELGATIGRVVADLDAERAERQLRLEMQEKLKMGLPLLREKFLLSLVDSAVPKSDLRERIDFLGLELPDGASYWAIVLSVDDLAEVTGSRSERDRQLLWYSVINICQELIDRHIGGYIFEHRVGEFVGILRIGRGEGSAPDASEALLALAADIQDNLERYLKIGVTVGIGDRAGSLSELPRSYRQAFEAAEQKWYLGKNRIITMDSLDGAAPEGAGGGKHDSSLNESLLAALKAADELKLREVLDGIFADLGRGRRDGLKYGRNVCLQLVLAVGQLLLELGASSPELEEAEARLWEKLFEQETLGEMRHLLEEHLTAACGRIRERRSGKAVGVIERVRAVIEENYPDGGLTVAEIAKEVYLTPTYVSLLFKQETGQTVNEYLTQVRVEKAKELLRDPKYKFYDICHAIGYTDPSYFTKLFKKATGVTPSAYRHDHA